MAMHDQNVAILKGLVSVAWADGEYADSERQAIDGLLAAFSATPEESEEIRRYAAEPRRLEDIPLTDLSADDRRMLYAHAVLLTFVDGVQAASERTFLDALARYLRIPPDEAEGLAAASAARAKKYIELLA